ncbi:MAG: universal stress protein, partial [Candidatus Heimdallarchaeota archaeon]|nr:universal stress protein [Candidatus Heimdallarchaeota archaeon]
MYLYKRLLVSLSMYEGDESLIRYAGMFARISKAEKVYFLHVAENLDIPDKIRKEYPDMLRPLDEFSVNGMDEAVKKFFNGPNQTEISYDVVEGTI